MPKLTHIISSSQFRDQKLLRRLFASADEMEKKDRAGRLKPILNGKLLACVFYEPSTRTRFSFEAAMFKLGGQVITTESAGHFSSAVKGESLEDSIRIIGGYADAIVLRHSVEGSALAASKVSPVPIINAGDGIGEHPTQALLDLYTIEKELGGFDHSTIGLVGDLLNGRTVHSLVNLLGMYKNIKLYFCSPPQLQLPAEYKSYLRKQKITFEEVSDLKEIASLVDILYVTRVQKERFSSQEEYERLKNAYVVDRKLLNIMKKKSIILHPLPRVSEISPEIDSDPHAGYFRQARNGMYVRMALLKEVLV